MIKNISIENAKKGKKRKGSVALDRTLLFHGVGSGEQLDVLLNDSGLYEGLQEHLGEEAEAHRHPSRPDPLNQDLGFIEPKNRS